MKCSYRLIACLIVITSFSLIDVGCQPAKPTHLSQSKPVVAKEVTLATSTNVWCALPLIAKEKGFFEEEDVNVKLSIQDGGRYCMDALLSKSAELGNVVEINVAYVGFTGNDDVVVVANTVESTGMAIVAKKSSGIAQPSDLSGKRFAYTPGTQGDLFAHRFFEKHQIDPKSLEMHKLQPKAIPAAVGAGGVDAASTWEPFVNSCLVAMGADAVVFRDPQAHVGYMHLAARRDWVEKNPETMKSILRALKKAERFCAEHQVEAQLLLAKQMNLSLDATKEIWPYFMLELSMDSVQLTEVTTRVGEWIEKTQENYAGKQVPDYSMFFNSRFYNEAFEPLKQ